MSYNCISRKILMLISFRTCFETSAMTGLHIREVFEYAAETLPKVFPPESRRSTKGVNLEKPAAK
jgi:hypothetical protein